MYNYNDDSTSANSVPIISVGSRDNINISVVGSLCRRKNVEEAILYSMAFYSKPLEIFILIYLELAS